MTRRTLIRDYADMIRAQTELANDAKNKRLSTITARIALVKGMHARGSRNGQIGRCTQCGREYPCPTLRALTGEYDA